MPTSEGHHQYPENINWPCGECPQDYGVCGIPPVLSSDVIVERAIWDHNWRLFDSRTEEEDPFGNIRLKAT